MDERGCWSVILAKNLYFAGDGKRGEIALTRREREVMEILMRRAGMIVSTEMILNSVWGDKAVGDEVVRALIKYVRRKLSPLKKVVDLLSFRGQGYSLVPRREKVKLVLLWEMPDGYRALVRIQGRTYSICMPHTFSVWDVHRMCPCHGGVEGNAHVCMEMHNQGLHLKITIPTEVASSSVQDLYTLISNLIREALIPASKGAC